jgi:hypothetical protein
MEIKSSRSTLRGLAPSTAVPRVTGSPTRKARGPLSFFLEARGRACDINGWILLVDRLLVSLSLGLVLKKRLLHGTRKQRVPQPEWVTDMKSLLIICAVALLVQSSPVWSQEALPPLKKQPTEEAVLAEHLDALNHCDWNRLLAQYPDDFQMNLPGGEIVKGREAAGKVFAGFCKDRKEGGLKGITFTPQDSVKIGNVFATQWVVTAPFLAEPYKGSDAYIIENGYLRAMVSTFDGKALNFVK